MDTTNTDQFAWVEWIISERLKHEWTQSDLARKAGTTRQTINDYESRRRVQPDEKILGKISMALGYPTEYLLRIANILPPEPAETKLTRQITHITSQLPPEEQQGLLEFAKLRLRLSEKQGKYETRKPAKHTGSTK